MKPRSCLAIACLTAFNARVDFGPAGTRPGHHRVVVTADGKTYSCSFAVAPRSQPQAEPLDCSPGLTVWLVDDGVCPDRGPNRICHLMEVVSVDGTPSVVHVQQFLDESVVLDHVVHPKYQGIYASGPECGIYCYAGNVTWTIQ